VFFRPSDSSLRLKSTAFMIITNTKIPQNHLSSSLQIEFWAKNGPKNAF